LLTSPKLAYFDEPTVGLDPVSRRNLLNLIKLNKASVLFTTHRLDEAEFLCNRVAIM
jgi:ABC-2 type transport system ATP-binding protein